MRKGIARLFPPYVDKINVTHVIYACAHSYLYLTKNIVCSTTYKYSSTEIVPPFLNQAICNIIPFQQKEHLFSSLQHLNPQAQLQLLLPTS